MTSLTDTTEINALAAELARKIAELEIAVAAARQTGAAVGIIMATEGLDESAAWALLALAGHHSHTEMAAVARHVVSIGRLIRTEG